MRLIQVFVPSDDHDAVREALSEMEVEFIFNDADNRQDGSLANVPVPTGAVDEILDRLYDAGLDEDTYTVVTDVDQAKVPNVDELTDRYVGGPKGKRGSSNTEIRERAEDLTPDTATYISFAIASAVVAVAGLLLDSAIVVVGAMVIAPFAGSTLSMSVGAVISDRKMVIDSATSQIVGLVVAYVGAVAMSLFLQRSGFVPATLEVGSIGQVSAFAVPSLLTLVIAIAAGFAGALAIATDLPVSLAGVAVAAAIVPAAAVAGIGTAWGQQLVVAGSVVLLLMNIVFLNITAYLTLVALGYRSSVIQSVRENRTVSLRSGAYALVALLFLVAVAVTGFGTYQHLVFEQQANGEVQNVLSDDEYSNLELEGVKSEYNDASVFSDDITLTVTVGRSSDLAHENLAEDLQGAIADETGRSVSVDVRFVDYQSATTLGAVDNEQGPWLAFDEVLALAPNPSLAQPTPQTSALPLDLVDKRADSA